MKIIKADPAMPAVVEVPKPAAPPFAHVATPAKDAPTAAPIPVVAPPTKPVPPTPAILPVIKDCPRPFANPDLVLTDGRGFDRKLRAKLSRGGAVVDLSQPYASGSDAPAALAPWLNEVKSSGGSVTVRTYCTSSRGFLDFLKKIFNGQPRNSYKAAHGYDAVLHANALDQVVTQVEFTPRAPK